MNKFYLLQLKATVKVNLSQLKASKYSIKFAAKNIWNITIYLNKKSLIKRKRNRFFFSSIINLFNVDLYKLFTNVLKYNAQYLSRFHNYNVELDFEFATNLNVAYINILNSFILSALILNKTDQMFVDWNCTTRFQTWVIFFSYLHLICFIINCSRFLLIFFSRFFFLFLLWVIGFIFFNYFLRQFSISVFFEFSFETMICLILISRTTFHAWNISLFENFIFWFVLG